MEGGRGRSLMRPLRYIDLISYWGIHVASWFGPRPLIDELYRLLPPKTLTRPAVSHTVPNPREEESVVMIMTAITS